ncbi:MAG: BREX-4 system phosphatase PglZ [Ruminococcus sp.]|nr:BREX-4 system phosphatase PglZ [Ruminococcus sp.]
MQLFDEKSCFNEITAYFNSEVSGYPFIANIDDSAVLQNVISKMQADSSKKILKISDYCNGDNLPNVYKFKSDVKALQNGVVLGYTVNDMFLGEQALKQAISELLQLPVKGHVVIFVYGCSGLLRNAIYADGNRADHRTMILESKEFSLPTITMTVSNEITDSSMIQGFSDLLGALEKLSYDKENPNLLVYTKISPNIYKYSMVQIDSINGIYGILCKSYPEIKSCTEQDWGSEEQWKKLYEKLKKSNSLSSLINKKFGSTVNLSMMMENAFEDVKSETAWLLWLAMKVFGTKENSYLALAVKKSKSVKSLIELIYMELLCYPYDDANFLQFYKERKQLIEKLPENLALIQKYCGHVGQYDKNAVYYLTNLSDKEKYKFLYYLGKEEYSFTESEILSIVNYAFPELYEYLGDFEFNARNTKNPTNDSALLSTLTKYFHDYKLQKVTNRIFPEFMDIVNKNAVSRPFTKLLPRISVVKDIDKTNAQIHFFDALGVEYLAYILQKCEILKLQTVVHIAHCELPSITRINKDFTKFFKIDTDEEGNEKIPGTKELDELKHHSKEIDYRKIKEPIHLFSELAIIDKELKQIQEMLINHEFDKIVIISDHGASRLSVIHQSVCQIHSFENHGKHSGRCCPVENVPDVPEIIYENGYAVLSNYDRFKGSRPANVEVHGGATLEETVIPIIEITLKPKELDIHIINANKPIEFHNKEIVSIIISSNIIIHSPKLIIKGLNTSFSCECDCCSVIDETHYKFKIPGIKRSGKFTADFYDGDKLVQKEMRFETKKAVGTTRELL